MNVANEKQEFFTAYGFAVFERDVVYFRSPYLPFFKTAFAQIGYALLLPAVFILQFFRQNKLWLIGAFAFGLLMLTNIDKIYHALFKKSYFSRIPLKNIVDFSTEEDQHGLQTTLKLKLQNGRYKEVLFRTHEGQLEPFTQLLSQYIHHPQFA